MSDPESSICPDCGELMLYDEDAFGQGFWYCPDDCVYQNQLEDALDWQDWNEPFNDPDEDGGLSN
jgi:hypothetical protein